MKRKFRYIKNQKNDFYIIQCTFQLFGFIPSWWQDIVIFDKDSEYGSCFTCTAKSEEEAKMLVKKYESGELKY